MLNKGPTFSRFSFFFLDRYFYEKMKWYGRTFLLMNSLTEEITYIFQVVGVPVTINGDLKNQFVEANVGFDTICKVIEIYFLAHATPFRLITVDLVI